MPKDGAEGTEEEGGMKEGVVVEENIKLQRFNVLKKATRLK